MYTIPKEPKDAAEALADILLREAETAVQQGVRLIDTYFPGWREAGVFDVTFDILQPCHCVVGTLMYRTDLFIKPFTEDSAIPFRELGATAQYVYAVSCMRAEVDDDTGANAQPFEVAHGLNVRPSYSRLYDGVLASLYPMWHVGSPAHRLALQRGHADALEVIWLRQAGLTDLAESRRLHLLEEITKGVLNTPQEKP
jgi:hypothetical protein